MLTNKMPKNAKIFYCEKCDFKCSKESNYNKHLNTRKHKMLTNTDKKMPKNAKICYCECGKSYKHRQSLHIHKKKCTYQPSHDTEISVEPTMEYLLKENLDIKNDNLEMKKLVVDVCQKMETVATTTNNNINNTINNNKTFNINVFLNEQCKDAMNLTDFIDSIQLSLEDVDRFGYLGQTKGMENILVRKLGELDILKRPVHCSDIQTETIYIKDEDKWEKESIERSKLKNVLDDITKKTIEMIPKVSSTEYEKTTSEILKDPREDNKIIAIVAKQIIL
jgi:hypothetical protein